MERLLHEGLEAGGIGFSSSWARTHNDADGHMVPSRYASRDEIIALCRVTGELPGHRPWSSSRWSGRSTPWAIELMADMSAGGPAPAELERHDGVTPRNLEQTARRSCTAGDYAAAKGRQGRRPDRADELRGPLHFASGFVLDAMPGWEDVMLLPRDEKLAAVPGPRRARRLSTRSPRADQPAAAGWPTGPTRSSSTWSPPRTSSTRAPRSATSPQSRDATPGTSCATSPSPTSCNTSFGTIPAARERRGLEGPPRDLAGLPRRDRRLRRRRPPRPAGLVQLRHRAARQGRAAAPAPAARGGDPSDDRRAGPPVRADGPGPRRRGLVRRPRRARPRRRSAAHDVAMRFDLPGGAGRLYAEADGIDHVFVNGRRIVPDGQLTDARSGTLLRSGRDTETAPLG